MGFGNICSEGYLFNEVMKKRRKDKKRTNAIVATIEGFWLLAKKTFFPLMIYDFLILSLFCSDFRNLTS